MKCVKKAKEHLKTNVHDLSKEKEVLCSERVFKALDRRSKRRKVPEISPKRCNFKKKSVSTRHHNLPFVQGPHVGMEIVGADSLHKCRNNVIRVKENLCSQITIFQRNQERKQVWEIPMVFSCYATNKNMSSLNIAFLSDTYQVQRNLKNWKTS